MSTAPTPGKISLHEKIRHLTLDWPILLGFLALLFAIPTLVIDINLHHVATDIRHSTNEFVQATTTRYVAQFPDDVGEIINIVNATCANIDIMTDTPGYAVYSKAKAFDRYRSALHGLLTRENAPTHCPGAKDKPQVRLLIFPSSDRNQMNREEQFPKDGFLKALETKDEQAKFIAFCEQNMTLIRGYSSPQEFLNQVLHHGKYEDFLRVVSLAEDRAEEDFASMLNVKVRHATNHYTLYAWIRDGAKAVFSFQYRPDPTKQPSFTTSEVAFRTEDHTLLSSFEEIFEQEWCRSKESMDHPDKECGKYLLVKDSDTDEIKALLNSCRDAWNKGDLEALVSYYEDSPKTSYVGDEILYGQDKISAHYGHPKGKLELSLNEVRPLAKGLALALGEYTLTTTDKTEIGHFSLIVRKTNSNWKIIHDHSSRIEPKKPN
jgi:uncharacterized protein (TIGR02246 family)